MDNKPSKDTKLSPTFKTIATVQCNNDKVEQVEMLLRNIRTVIDKMKQDVEIHPLIPKRIFKDLFVALDSFGEIMNPERPHVCYCIGCTDVGKSSLINSICEEEVCKVGHDDKACTADFQRVPVPTANAVFIDTEGFGAILNDTSLVKRFKTQVKRVDPPDAVLLVVTKHQLREMSSLKNVTDSINQVLKWLQKQRYGSNVPVICVLNKIDEYFEGRLPNSEADDQKVEEYMQKALQKVNEFLSTPASHCIAVSAKHNYGIDQLRLILNAQSPLNAQIMDKTADYISRYRRSIANKIIAAFSIASAAISFLPFVDILVVTLLQEWMYRMLACFSVDPSRTPDTFKTVHRVQQGANIGIRVAALGIGGIFQLCPVGYLVGSAICVAAASSTTATLGWACYHYFTQ